MAKKTQELLSYKIRNHKKYKFKNHIKVFFRCQNIENCTSWMTKKHSRQTYLCHKYREKDNELVYTGLNERFGFNTCTYGK